MGTLDVEFAQAVRNVTILRTKSDLATAAHTEVREVLEADPLLCEWGIDTILIGSYARLTSRYPAKDVDVFLRLRNLSVRHDPQKIYDAVERVLIARYRLKDRDPGGRVTRQARSLSIDFPGEISDLEFHIDAVPAVPWQENWGIPNRDRDVWDDNDKRWVKTNPVQFSADTTALATAAWTPTVSGDNAYRPIVRLLRQVRHVHVGEDRPGGLYTEVAAYYAWKEKLVAGGTWATLLASSLEQVSVQFGKAADRGGLFDPVLGSLMKPFLEPWHWRRAAATFGELSEQARLALESERCRAAKIWRDILGTNERGSVLPLPDGCDAGGFPVGTISAVTAVGSNDPRGFASPVAHLR